MAGNLPKFCGLVMFTWLFAVFSQRVCGNRLLASIRTVTRYFSR